MTEHTKLPWKMIDLKTEYDNRVVMLTEDDAILVARSPRIADAVFIVRACNSHDELLEACEKLIQMIDYAVDAGMNGSISNTCPTVINACAAIIHAKGGEA